MHPNHEARTACPTPLAAVARSDAGGGSFIAIVGGLDSNRAFLARLARTLSEAGRVSTLASASDALYAFRRDPPDLIIADFHPRGMSAAAFLAEFREPGPLEDIPVIVISSEAKPESRCQALLNGAADFLAVPFDTLEFQARARNHLRLSLHRKLLRKQSFTLRNKLAETRLRSLKAFQRTRERFAAIIDCIPALIFAVDGLGDCVFANAYCYDFLGSSPDSGLIGAQKLANAVAQAAAMRPFAQAPSGAEIRLIGRDSQEHSFLVVARTIPGKTRPECLTIYSGVEISALKQTESELRKARCEAEAAKKTKSAFLANMSHEIRTPLNAIIGFASIMRNELFGPMRNERYRDYVLDIEDSASDLLVIIDEILDFSQIEAGQGRLALRDFSLLGCFGEVVRLLEGQVRARKNSLVVEAAEDFKLRSDSRKLGQVFINILSNANSFMNGGRIAVSCSQAPSGELALIIEDNGIGMGEEELAIAMQDFGRVSASAFLSRDQPGAGLGLPISIGLMKLLGGRLDIESRKGQGTMVRLTLPQSAILGKTPVKARFCVPSVARPKLINAASNCK
jgi:signal transduction histidine kinase